MDFCGHGSMNGRVQYVIAESVSFMREIWLHGVNSAVNISGSWKA